MSLATVIKAKRTAALLSTSELARRCKVSVNWMATVERGEKLPSDHLLDRLTEVLDDKESAIHLAAALERGSVTITVEKNAEQLVPVLLAFKASAPKMSLRMIREISDTFR